MKPDWPRELEGTLAEVQKDFSQDSSEKDSMSEEKKAVAELRTILSQYLSF